MDYHLNISNVSGFDAEEKFPTSTVSLLDGRHQVPSVQGTVIGSIIMIVFLVEGLLGTILILFALLGNPDLRRNVINVFVISLCANDLCTLSFVVSLIVDSYVWRRWHAGDLLCRLNPELTVAFTGCTLWHTALIAIHRYISVVHPNAYKRLSKRFYTCFVLIAARALPLVCCLPALTDFGSETMTSASAEAAVSSLPTGYVPKLLRCVLPSGDRRRIMLVTTMLTIVPCVVVVLCYIAVLGYVSAAACRVKNSTMRRELRVSAIFGSIFLVVLGGFTPYTVARSLDRDYHFDADVYVVVTVCYAVATCSSPLVYGALSTQIRQACIEVVVGLVAVARRLLIDCGPVRSGSSVNGSHHHQITDIGIVDSPQRDLVDNKDGSQLGRAVVVEVVEMVNWPDTKGVSSSVVVERSPGNML